MSVDRRPMKRQRSLNASDASALVSPMHLDRRNTVTLPRNETKQLKGLPPTSPLRRFAEAKESISRVFARVHEQLEEVVSFLANIPGVAHKVTMTIF